MVKLASYAVPEKRDFASITIDATRVSEKLGQEPAPKHSLRGMAVILCGLGKVYGQFGSILGD
jgi:hypothetical protein